MFRKLTPLLTHNWPKTVKKSSFHIDSWKYKALIRANKYNMLAACLSLINPHASFEEELARFARGITSFHSCVAAFTCPNIEVKFSTFSERDFSLK